MSISKFKGQKQRNELQSINEIQYKLGQMSDLHTMQSEFVVSKKVSDPPNGGGALNFKKNEEEDDIAACVWAEMS